MLKQLLISTAAAFTLIATASAAPIQTAAAVQIQIDWPSFLARHDMVWDSLPQNFDCGAFLGNGMLGATIYQDGDNRLRFEMGRSDVTEHRRDNARLPIGGLVLTTAGKIKSGTMRLDLWNAEVRGTLLTDKGSLDFRSFIHTEKMLLIIDVKAVDGEAAAAFAWNAAKCTDRDREVVLKDPPHPGPCNATDGEVAVCTQGRASGGEFATAYAEKTTPGSRRLYLSIADSFPGNTAAAEAVAQVRQSMAADFDRLLKTHRDWWNAFYPQNFVSIPDAKLESFYWIQWYKLASASRPDRVPVDLLGPWFRKTGWPRIWWNLNIESLYLPVYTGNRLELGESFVNFIDKQRDNFFLNGKEIWKFDDCATVPHTTDYEGLRGDGDCAPDQYLNPGDFTWALQNYFLHYRYTMDHTMITDQKKHAFYPLLKGSVNLYLKILKPGEDEKLHLPVLMSPEYGLAADNNYNLGLLRWGCQTLIDLNQRYQLNDSMVPIWEQTMKDLVPYPVDENGLCIGSGVPFKMSHRHWSHILMVHPLHIMTADNPSDRELLNKSVLHWLTADGATGINGWSRAGAASLYATLGDGSNALKQIHGHLADKRFVRPNTMYIEGDPVIECSIVLNRSLQDMLLQSWGGKINIFPAVPAAWNDAVFHDLRAEGAFLVSANRKDGKTEWLRVKSLAGEPCRVQAVFASTPILRINGEAVPLQPATHGIFDLPLKKDDEALIFTGEQASALVKPLPMPVEDANLWGGGKRLSDLN
ncbi:MAG: glycoside hydrolase family 95-like protein [Verrucomicrobiota bacterium]